MRFSYELVTQNSDLLAAFWVRRTVFVEEQGIPEELDFDGLDREALHLVVKYRNRVIGTARVRFPDNKQAKIERMAILKPFRRVGIGRQIISFLVKELANRHIEQVVLYAQSGAVDFYRACGFEESGPPFIEAGLQHVKMLRRIRGS